MYDASEHPIGGGAGARSLPAWPDARPLRSWQKQATEAVREHAGTSFLASATPAAGKTTFGLHIAHRMLKAGFVSRVVVAGPTTHICRQWAADAGRYGIDLEPNRPNADGPESADFHGLAVTYQTIAAGPKTHRLATSRRPTLLIADEPHHMGDLAAWGLQTRKAFDGARFRLLLLLSGTPFRSDNSAIPWVTYDDDGLSQASPLSKQDRRRSTYSSRNCIPSMLPSVRLTFSRYEPIQICRAAKVGGRWNWFRSDAR